MSLIFNNSKIFNGVDKQLALVEYTLVNESLDCITLDGEHPNHHDMVVYLPEKLHSSFINKMEKAPVRKFNCQIKSLQNVVTNVYKDSRTTNASGNISMSKYHPELFTHLKVYENQASEEIFLFIDDLIGYQNISPHFRSKLFQTDMEHLESKGKSLKSINLIINVKYADYIPFNSIFFKSVTFFRNYEEGIQQFLENKFGIKVSGQFSPFVKTIELNTGAEVDLVVSTGNSIVNARSRGRFDFNGCNKDETGVLLIIGENLKKIDNQEFHLPIISRDYTPNYLNQLLKLFVTSTNLPSDKSTYKSFLEKNKDFVFDYLLGNKNELLDNDKINILMNQLYSKFWSNLIEFIEKMKYENEPKTPEYPRGFPLLNQMSSVPMKNAFRGLSSFE